MTSSGTTLVQLTRRAHERYAAFEAVVHDQGSLTFAQLGSQSRRLASGLYARGVKTGQAVIWAVHNRPETLVIEHSLFGSGLVRVALSPRLHSREIAAIAADCSAAAIFCEPSAAADIRDASAEVADNRDSVPNAPMIISAGAEMEELVNTSADQWPDIRMPTEADTAALMYTSGTTGEPKGAIVTQRAWLTMVRGFWSALPPLGPGDLAIHAAPMSHFGGSVGSAVTFKGGAVLPIQRYSDDLVLDLVSRRHVTVLPCVPTILQSLTETVGEHTDLDSLRAVVYGGSAIGRPAAQAAVSAFGDRLYQCYGLAEALAPLTVLDPRDHHGMALDSAGRPLPEVEVRIGSAGLTGKSDDRPQPGTGEIFVRGPAVTAGYWNRPDATSAAIDDQGWFATGDIGRVDDAGFLHIVDRAKDVIISGGFTIYPSEVERVIRSTDGVDEVVVFGVPDSRWGEAVMAVVVPADAGRPLTVDQVLASCRAQLASYKKPSHVKFQESLPLTTNGKIDRRRLQAEAVAKLRKGAD